MNDNHDINQIVIVGGGAAGWLSASILAAHFKQNTARSVAIKLIESPDIPTIGVGEGTWPSMRLTLQKLGVKESDFLSYCGASFKQGSRFTDWLREGHSYEHPFSTPIAYENSDPAVAWHKHRNEVSFAEALAAQTTVGLYKRAPKTIATPDYAYKVNYGYHLDAGKFGELLAQHATQTLNVELIRANVIKVNGSAPFIDSVDTDIAGTINGDLFIDCSGQKALLIEGHCAEELTPLDEVLFNNRAVAIQAPYATQEEAIESYTVATAIDAGWIWDIGLQHRRGTGLVYSDRFLTADRAEETLRSYLAQKNVPDHSELSAKHLHFSPGYRERRFTGNCLAVGMSAGFIEPLEATALVLVEESANMLCRILPKRASGLAYAADRFNSKFNEHWRNIERFLKLHYVLSERSEDYWVAHRDERTWPSDLKDCLAAWRERSPSTDDVAASALFPAASYQYIYHGMLGEFSPAYDSLVNERTVSMALREKQKELGRLMKGLPSNREYFNNFNK